MTRLLTINGGHPTVTLSRRRRPRGSSTDSTK